MQELRLVAVSEDGTYLVLATAGRGTRFTLPVDDRLRAAVRGHFSRLGQFEIEVESPLRPKEIQARIRSGETAEEIAESAGIPVERVRWFEGPVLQEREYMAQQAQRVTVRRPGESTPGPPLGETVEERLGRGGVDLEEVEWDSWKCEDSTWRVRLSFFEGGRPHAAEWTFDPRRRHVSPLDEVAARLTSVEWDDDDALSDTVTPLVPRRPAMKVVSSDRDAATGGRGLPSRGLPAEPEQSAPEPLRAAEPRAYIVERGRMVDPRPAFREAAEPPSLREAAAPPRPAVRAPEPSRPAPPAEEAAPEAPSAEALADEAAKPVQSEEPHGVAAGSGTAEPPGSPGMADEDAGDLAGETAEPVEENADEAAAAEKARPAEAAEAAEEPEDGASVPEEIEALDGDGAEEVREAEHASAAEPAEPAETASPEQAGDDHEAAEAHKAGEAPEAVEAPEPVQAAPSPEPEEPAEPAETPQVPAASAPRVPEDERETAPVRTPAPPREPAVESTPAAPARQPSRPPAKKKPATRPTMPAAAQDKPATGSPAAAAAAGEPAGSPRPARRRKAKGKRASVPSWDEIMFGARRPE
ncbi:hypothetical protein BJY14_006790 [Actinomadura luteofluorescens]|uniref:DUF3071 domain-containing protein n=1 Tax=Actinomadura luteofluorescens TaxID=46163 RepID=A0A7Y9EN54_9ACTN|nr:septation protein SepH [Actinomadura luteofluorescens]NYD50807.1 hypothetical protein [Actinomadura luteofluorescens]